MVIAMDKPARTPRTKRALPYHEKKWFSESKIFGGKTYLARPIFRLAPPAYAVYVDCYGGEGSMTYNAPGGPIAYYNDLNWFRYNTKRVIKEQGEGLVLELQNLKYTEETFTEHQERLVEYEEWVNNKNSHWMNRTSAHLAAAVTWIVTRRMSRLGLGKDFGWSDRQRGGQPGDVNAWDNMIIDMPAKTKRLAGVYLNNMPAIELMDMVAETHKPWPIFLYCDPTYPKTTRQGGREYGQFEMTPEQHKDLCLAAIRQPKHCCIAISSYDNPLYNETLTGWSKHLIKSKCRAGQKKTLTDRTEVLYVNY